jgi:hypothetical protein
MPMIFSGECRLRLILTSFSVSGFYHNSNLKSGSVFGGQVNVAERIRELKSQREKLEHSLQELKRPRAIPLHLFKGESIASFQQSIKSMFIQCDDRRLIKRYLQLFIEKIVINLPKVEIVAKPEVILAVLENKTAVRTDGVLTAVGDWLPSTDSNRGPGG